MNVPFILAPMAELSHRALRELVHGFGGCSYYFTEMISAAALAGGGPFEKWYADGGPCPERVVYQLAGSDAAAFARAVPIVDALPCAGIDINMGCSAPLIRKAGAGAAWMADADRAAALIERLRPLTAKPLSVKLRIGFTDDFDYLLTFCRRLQDAGLDRLTLHGRTVTEKFKRRARWDYTARLRQELSIPVAGNGDVETAADLVSRAAGPCDAVMAGRAAVRQPWIFAQARKMMEEDINNEPHEQERMPVSVLEETGLRFLDLLARHQPPEFHISRARRFFSLYCGNFTFGTWLFNQLSREETLAGIAKVFSAHCKTQ